MKIRELFENQTEFDVKVVFGGRFQPFHKGHYKVYQFLTEKFGIDNVYLATSNKTNFHNATGDISPFNFNEKKKIISTLYDIEEEKILQTTNPLFFPKELVDKNKDSKFITVTGMKNVNRFESSNSIKLYKDDSSLQTGDYFYLPIFMQENGLSSSIIRKKIKQCESEDEKKSLFNKMLGKYDKDIFDLINFKLSQVK